MDSLRLLTRSTDNYDAKIEGATVNVGSTPYIYNKVRMGVFSHQSNTQHPWGQCNSNADI